MAGQTLKEQQNLINPGNAAPRALPTGFYRSLILDIFSVFTALGFGYAYYRYLSVGASPWFVLATLLALSVTSVLQVLLAKVYSRRFLVVFLEALALIAPFFKDDNWEILLITAVVMLGVLFWGYLSARAYFTNSVEIPFFGLTGNVLGKVTTAAVLMMILVYTPHVTQGNVFTPPRTFETFFTWSSGFLNVFFPNVPLNGTFGSFSAGIAKSELDNNATFQSMSSSSQSEAIDQASTQVAGLFSNSAGMAPASTTPTSQVIYGYIVNTLSDWQNHFQNGFVIGWALVLFIVLRTLGIVYVWLAQFVTLIFYEILVASGFMHVAEIPQTKEIMEY